MPSQKKTFNSDFDWIFYMFFFCLNLRGGELCRVVTYLGDPPGSNKGDHRGPLFNKKGDQKGTI